MRALLDTSVLITGGFVMPPEITEVSICSISYAELEQGLVRPGISPAVLADRKLQVLEIRQAFGPGVPFDDMAAMYYGRIVEAIHAAGRSPKGRIADLMIAAVARAHGAAVVTHNVADFAGLERMVRVIPAG